MNANIQMNKSKSDRELNTRDVGRGIGRKATDKELEEYLNRPHGKSIPLKQAIEIIKRKLHSGK
jgi:hypothetical protein